jgi:UDP-glucose 4-epimerase
MRNIAITGGRGFIGSHLVDHLASKGYSPIIIDNLSNSTSSSWKGFTRHRFYEADIRDKDIMKKIFEKENIDTCIHLAALISVVDSVRDPVPTLDVNINGTVSVLQACASNRVNNFVLASTGAIYGEPKTLPIRENDAVSPMSPYGASKISAEMIADSYMNCSKIKNATSLRFFNVYGERQSDAYAGVIKIFAERLSTGLPPVIRGDGEQTRDFVFVGDIVRAICLAAENETVNGSFNIATGTNITINKLAKVMIKIFGADVEPEYIEPNSGEVRAALVDITKARQKLGYEPTHSLEYWLKAMFQAVIAKRH